ncbi:MAG: M23 family metallopeptidase [Sphingomonadaceae bacterium]
MLGCNINNVGIISRFRAMFRPRDLFFHDGNAMRRVHVSARTQTVAATATAALLGLSLIGTAQIAGSAPMVAAVMSRDAAVSRMEAQVASMRADMATIRKEAAVHAAALDQRQAFLDAVLTGKGAPTLPTATGKVSGKTAAIVQPLAATEARQVALAAKAQAALDARYTKAAAALGRFGISPARFVGKAGAAMGGPYEPVDTTAVKGQADPAFKALFQSWKRLDQLQTGAVAIPSQRPVDVMTLTSGFGVRRDPFRGSAAMHAGVDIPGAHGAAIYATADGLVGRTGRLGGYGNLVELEHGRGIQTRYGHLSAILVQPGQRVKRGDLIARMGSTGRSTGTHLHYEVRLDGEAVNPMPFLQSAEYLAAMQARSPASPKVAMGGPAE